MHGSTLINRGFDSLNHVNNLLDVLSVGWLSDAGQDLPQRGYPSQPLPRGLVHGEGGDHRVNHLFDGGAVVGEDEALIERDADVPLGAADEVG